MGIRVGCPAAEELAWLARFLAPHFAVGAGVDCSCRVEVVRDQQRFDDLLARGASGPEVEAFVFDSHVERLPLWGSPDQVRTVFDAENRLFYLETEPRRRFTLVAPAGDGILGRTGLMRVVRELATSHARCAGGHLIHGAAFARRDRAAIVVGDKGSGKTTLLLYMLTRGKAALLSNDRVLVSRGGDELEAHGVPTIFTVLPSSLERLPDLGRRLLDGAFDHRLLPSEIEARASFPFVATPKGKWAFSPADVAARAPAPAVAAARPTALLFPRLDSRRKTLSIQPLSPREAAAAVSRGMFGGADATRMSEVFLPSGPMKRTARADLERFSRELVRRVPAFRCHLGTDAYRDSEAARRLAALLATPPPEPRPPI